jgi:polysaccharide biosynthesis protein PslG
MLKASSLCLAVALAVGSINAPANPTRSEPGDDLSRVIPNNMGVMVHDTSDANLDRAANGGFKLIRIDLTWFAIEKAKGTYDWTEYDAIVSRLKARNLHPLFVLNFNHPEYSGNGEMDGIDTPEERNGFANFAVSAVRRYQDAINPLWEIYNEPNRPTFWRDPSAENYMKLIEVVVPSMRRAKPGLFIMGPGLGHAPALDGTDQPIKVDFGYLESTFALGILNYVDAISIHPYPDGEPELALDIYRDVRELMETYGRVLPIVSSEWGYSSAASFTSARRGHADFLTRMYLVNLSQDVPSIAYKLEAGSPDPGADDYERQFSWFEPDGRAKPVYTDVANMIQALQGLSFVTRVPSDANDYLLEFSDGTRTLTAAWTTASRKTVTIYGRAVDVSGTPVFVDLNRGTLHVLRLPNFDPALAGTWWPLLPPDRCPNVIRSQAPYRCS